MKFQSRVKIFYTFLFPPSTLFRFLSVLKGFNGPEQLHLGSPPTHSSPQSLSSLPGSLGVAWTLSSALLCPTPPPKLVKHWVNFCPPFVVCWGFLHNHVIQLDFISQWILGMIYQDTWGSYKSCICIDDLSQLNKATNKALYIWYNKVVLGDDSVVTSLLPHSVLMSQYGGGATVHPQSLNTNSRLSVMTNNWITSINAYFILAIPNNLSRCPGF